MKRLTMILMMLFVLIVSGCTRTSSFERRMDDRWDAIETYILTADGNREGAQITRFDYLCYTFELEGFLPTDICMYFVSVTHPIDRNRFWVVSHRFDEDDDSFAHDELVSQSHLDAERQVFMDFLEENDTVFIAGTRD